MRKAKVLLGLALPFIVHAVSLIKVDITTGKRTLFKSPQYHLDFCVTKNTGGLCGGKLIGYDDTKDKNLKVAYVEFPSMLEETIKKNVKGKVPIVLYLMANNYVTTNLVNCKNKTLYTPSKVYFGIELGDEDYIFYTAGVKDKLKKVSTKTGEKRTIDAICE